MAQEFIKLPTLKQLIKRKMVDRIKEYALAEFESKDCEMTKAQIHLYYEKLSSLLENIVRNEEG